MQHFSNFSSDDGTEKKEGGGWVRDAAIGGLEAGLGFAATDKLHHAIANNPKLAGGFLGSKVGKVAVGVGTGAIGTLAVGAGLNAIGGLLKKKPKPEADPNTQQQTQYSYQGAHFADFAYDPVTKTGFGSTRQSFGTQSQTGKDAQWLMKNDREGYENYKNQGRAQSDKLRSNPNLNHANQGLPAQQVNRNINKTVVNNLGTKSPVSNVKGFLGKAKNTAGRAFGAIGGVGGLMTASYLAPSILGIFNSGQQQQNQNQEPPY